MSGVDLLTFAYLCMHTPTDRPTVLASIRAHISMCTLKKCLNTKQTFMPMLSVIRLVLTILVAAIDSTICVEM